MPQFNALFVARILTGGLLLLPIGLAQPVNAQTTTVYDARYDITGNNRIDNNDVESLRDSWNGLQSQNSCVAEGSEDRDVNSDGCVDIADIQQISSRVGLVKPGFVARGSGDDERTFVVNSAAVTEIIGRTNNKLNDVNPGDGICADKYGKCNLRAATQEASTRIGPDKIVFDIRNDDGSCPAVVTIRPNNNAVEFFLVEDNNTTIDGYTQCGASPNTNALNGNAAIKIQIDGGITSGSSTIASNYDVDGLTIRSSNNLIRGLSLYRWDHQILISSHEGSYNRIQGNFIGTSADNTYKLTSGDTHHREGLRLWYRASYNVIGCGSFTGNDFQACTSAGDTYAARNIIAGNGNDGIHFEGNPDAGSPDGNRIVGNYIGTKQDGITGLGNKSDAVDFEAGAINNWLGGESDLERNVIAGNGSEGIEISHSTRTQGNRVVGNWIGLDATGMKVLSNEDNGISFEDTVNHNFAYKNFTAGSKVMGGFRFYILANYNQVYDNYIGLMADKQTAAPNADDGVYAMGGSQYNIVRNNTIAFNKKHGIQIDPTSDQKHGYVGETYFNTLSQNSIYRNGEKGIDLNEKIMQDGRKFYGNQNRPAPTLKKASTSLVTGKVGCINCVVEVFNTGNTTLADEDGEGEGKTYLASATTGADGLFNIAITANVGDVLSATVTDDTGNTSEFSKNIVVGSTPVDPQPPGPTLTPTSSPTPTPTNTPIPTDTPTPSNTPTATNTPTVTNTPTATNTPLPTATLRPGETPPTATRTPVATPKPVGDLTKRVWVPVSTR